MDKIQLNSLLCGGRHGVTPEERQKPQQLRITLCAELDLSASAKSDCLTDTVNWSVLRKRVKGVVEGESYKLIEALCLRIIVVILEESRIQKVCATVAKLNAWDDAVPSITMERERSEVI